MKKNILPAIVAFAVISFVASPAQTQEEESKVKLAQTGFQFLSVGVDARPAAMAEAFTTVEGNASALFYNPAGMARMQQAFSLAASQIQWIADINYYAFCGAFSPAEGRYGVFGLSVMGVDYGEMQGTMVWPNADGYIDTEVFSPTAVAIGIGYARSLTDKFSVGGQAKWVAQSLGKSVVPDDEVRKNIASALAFDFGTIYRTGYKSLVFGMSVRNFSEEVKFEKEGFQLPLTFKIGFSIDAFDFFHIAPENHKFLIVADAAHPRSFSEYISIGGEYRISDIVAGRIGYVSGQDEYDITMGFGVKSFGLAFDYAYTPFGIFDNVQRFTIKYSR